MKSRKRVIAILGIITSLFIILLVLYGYDNTWRLWNIPTMSPHFADIRTITHGAESYAQGLDPMIENPGDPWHRRMNYPRIWQSLYFLGINHTHTTIIGLIIIFSFLVGICLILPNANNKVIIMVFSAVLSPAVLLGIERGNTDLFMFFLVSVAVLTVGRSYILSTFFIMTGFLLKLYPIFGVALLLKAERKKFVLYISIILAFCFLYAYASLPDLVQINSGTPKSIVLSYGMNVFWMGLSTINQNLGFYARLLSYFLVLLIFLTSFSAAILNRKVSALVSYDNKYLDSYLDSFRVGSAIYIGTFLLGNNFDYRLMFLIFVIPQLIFWSERPIDRVTVISKIVLLNIYISLWYLMIFKIMIFVPYGNSAGYVFAGYVLDEMSNWIVFSGLVYLFFLSLPTWAMKFAQNLSPLTKRST